MIRKVKVAKDVAVKARTSAMISLKSVTNAVPELREQLQPLSKIAMINRCAGLRPGAVTTVEAATKTHPAGDRPTVTTARRRDQDPRKDPGRAHRSTGA